MRHPGFVSNSGLPEERSWPHACSTSAESRYVVKINNNGTDVLKIPFRDVRPEQVIPLVGKECSKITEQLFARVLSLNSMVYDMKVKAHNHLRPRILLHETH